MATVKNTTYTSRFSRLAPRVSKLMYEFIIDRLLRSLGTRALAFGAGVAIIIASCTVPSVAQQPRTIPGYAAKVAGQDLAPGASWGIWLFGGKQGQGCWGTRAVRHHEVTSESVTCGYAVPRSPYQFAASGNVGTLRDPRSLLFFLLRPSVTHIEVLVKGPRALSGRWISVASRKVSSERRKASRLPRRLAFAIKAVRGNRLCPLRVKAYSGTRLVGRGSLPACRE
jgi:hypothetical protein